MNKRPLSFTRSNQRHSLTIIYATSNSGQDLRNSTAVETSQRASVLRGHTYHLPQQDHFRYSLSLPSALYKILNSVSPRRVNGPINPNHSRHRMHRGSDMHVTLPLHAALTETLPRAGYRRILEQRNLAILYNDRDGYLL